MICGASLQFYDLIKFLISKAKDLMCELGRREYTFSHVSVRKSAKDWLISPNFSVAIAYSRTYIVPMSLLICYYLKIFIVCQTVGL
jgi:hypothetical protein